MRFVGDLAMIPAPEVPERQWPMPALALSEPGAIRYATIPGSRAPKARTFDGKLRAILGRGGDVNVFMG
jgi:hypothetical protein